MAWAKALKYLAKKPAGPSIREAAEGAAEEGLSKSVLPEQAVKQDIPPRPKPEPKEAAEGELVDDVVEPEVQRIEADAPPEKEFKPATPEEAGEVVESVGQPKPTPDEQVSNTNYERWDTQAEMEAMWETTAKQSEAAGKGPKRMSYEAMIQAAKDDGFKSDTLGWVLKTVEDGNVDIRTLPGNVIMARQDAVELGEYLFTQAKKLNQMQQGGHTIDHEDLMQFEINLTKFRAIQEGLANITRTAGQLLSSFNYVAKGQGRVRFNQITELIEDAGGSESILQKAESIADLGKRSGNDLTKLSDDVQSSWLVRGAEALEAVRYNNMLSGLGTSLRNIVGNIFHGSYRVATTGTGALVGSGRNAIRAGNHPSAIAVSDFVGGTQSMTQSFAESIGLSVRSWKDPTMEIGQRGKIEVRRGVSIKTSRAAQSMEKHFGIFGRGFVEMVDLLGFSLGSRNLASGDIFFKNAAWRFETHMLAHQTARLEGLTGSELTARVEELLVQPKLPQDLYEIGMDAAAFATHTQSPDMGTFAKNFLQLRNTPGGLGWLMRQAVPFARVLVNIMTWSAKTATLPAHAIIPFSKKSAELRKAAIAGTREGNEYIGRLGVYATMFALVGQQTANNNITGTGRYVDARTLRQWRRGGWQPMSFRWRQKDGSYKYKSFAQLQPIGSLVGFMADMTDTVNYYSHPDSDVGNSLVDGASTAVQVLATGPLEAPFAKGLYEWMGMMFEERGASKAFKNVGRQYIGPANWLRDIEKITNPDRSQTYGDGTLDTMASQFQAGIPGWSSDLPPRLTVFGEDAEPATSPWSIMPTTISKHDDIFIALNDNGVHISSPYRPTFYIGGQTVNLLDIEDSRGEGWAFHEYKKLYGKMLLKNLNKAISSKDYRTGTVGMAGSGTEKKPARGSVLQRGITNARRETNERYHKMYPGSDFYRAYKGRKIKQDKDRPPARHAGMRERIEEYKEGVSF